MIESLSPEREQQIRARHEYGDEEFIRHCDTDMGVLLAELDRLRTANTVLKAAIRYHTCCPTCCPGSHDHDEPEP